MSDLFYSCIIVTMNKQIIDLLNETGHFLSVPKGVSMYPMLKSKENVVDIVPVKRKLEKYDVALYYRPTDDKYVLHRILRIEEDEYIFYGDNCCAREHVRPEQVVGVAEKFFYNGRWVSIENKWYRAYVHLWCDLLPIRVLIIRIRNRVKMEWKKLR